MRVWVIPSGQVDGNFGIYASYRHEGRWSDKLRVTSDPGPDVSPAAATDSAGAVWITWQGNLWTAQVIA